MFFVYFITQILHAFKYRNYSQRRPTVQHSLIPGRISEVTDNPQCIIILKRRISRLEA